MGYDSRFPHMFRVKDAPGLSTQHRATLSRAASAVCTRVSGLRCSYDARTESLFFHYGDAPEVGPMRLPAFNGDNPARIESHDIDAAVRFINYGRIPRTVKDRIDRNRKASEKHEHEVATAQFLDERRPSAIDYAAFKDRKRRGTHKVIA
jgi:hypothetical protein